jgi:hypothetical protein
LSLVLNLGGGDLTDDSMLRNGIADFWLILRFSFSGRCGRSGSIHRESGECANRLAQLSTSVPHEDNAIRWLPWGG